MADSNICRSSRKGFGIFLGEKKAVEKVNDLRNVLVEQEELKSPFAYIFCIFEHNIK